MPRLETPPRPGTSYELADAVLDWIAQNAPGEPLMPWQAYVVRRGFETAQGGRLWRQVAVLVSRQQGKTYMMQRVLLARLHLADLFGGTPSVLNTHPDVNQSVELLESIAREMESGYLRARANGADWWADAGSVRDLGRGAVWRARAQTRGAITGQGGVGMVFLDELQDARREVVNRALRPIMSGARVVNPQAWFAGTGERDGSDLLRALRDQGADPEGNTLWLEWSAPPGCATEDRVAWRWASPDWSAGREESLASDLRSMTVKEFRSEYLVQHDAQVTLWVEREVQAACARDTVVLGEERVGALEVSVDGRQWSAAVGDGAGLMVVVGTQFEEALGWLLDQGPGRVLVHQAVAHRLPLDGLPPVGHVTVAEATAASQLLAEAITSGSVVWDHGAEVAEQLAHVVLSAGVGGPRIGDRVSRGPVEVVKAMSWAHWGARRRPEPERAMIW